MTSTTPLRNPWRILRTIIYFNIPLIIVLLLFDFWRVSVHRSGGICTDFVCAVTAQLGDTIPLISSFTAEATRRSTGMNIMLARDLLLFNLLFGVVYMSVATIVFCLRVQKLGIIGHAPRERPSL